MIESVTFKEHQLGLIADDVLADIIDLSSVEPDASQDAKWINATGDVRVTPCYLVEVGERVLMYTIAKDGAKMVEVDYLTANCSPEELLSKYTEMVADQSGIRVPDYSDLEPGDEVMLDIGKCRSWEQVRAVFRQCPEHCIRSWDAVSLDGSTNPLDSIDHEYCLDTDAIVCWDSESVGVMTDGGSEGYYIERMLVSDFIYDE